MTLRTSLALFSLGLALGAITLAIVDRAHPAPDIRIPTAEQRRIALDAGWIEGTDGYYRAIYGPDAY